VKLWQQFWLLLTDTLRFGARKFDQRAVSLGLVLLGVVGTLWWANYWWTKNEQARQVQKIQLEQQLKVPIIRDLPHPIRIQIGQLVDAPITGGIVEGNNWTLSEQEAVYITQSARPDQPGNIIIYGHNTQKLLGNIRWLRGQETIKLVLDNGRSREYRVTERREIKPEDVWVIQPTDYEVLTLYTCSGFADKNRFVVRAIPIEAN
jgi:LPXTG-site transpeptidase (sortase) family protein